MQAKSPIRVMIVDDHTLFTRGLTALLACDPRIVVVGDAPDAGAALKRARDLAPDVVLLDNHLPGVNGVDALPALKETVPDARILMLTVSEDAQDLAAALRGGACGYLLKTMEGEALINAVLRAVNGESVVAEAMMGKLVNAYRDAAASARRRKFPHRQRSRSSRRASRRSCAASRAGQATRKSAATSASPRRRSRSTCSMSCASSTSPRACRRR